MTTMADGIAVGLPGDVPFAAVRDHVDEIITVSEESLSRAVLACSSGPRWSSSRPVPPPWRRCSTTRRASRRPTVAVLSGGNIDPLLLGKVIRHGLAAAGRYLNLHLRIPDRPGGLARLLSELAEAGANVLEVAHERIHADLSLDEVEVHLQLETRGREHAEAGARARSARARLPRDRVRASARASVTPGRSAANGGADDLDLDGLAVGLLEVDGLAGLVARRSPHPAATAGSRPRRRRGPRRSRAHRAGTAPRRRRRSGR